VDKQYGNSLAETHPEIASEALGWDPANARKTDRGKVKWQCSKGHTWETSIRSRVENSSGCHVCRKLPKVGLEDLKSQYPELSKEAHGWDPQEVFAASHSKLQWECKKGHLWFAVVKSRTLGGNNCPVCAGDVVLPGFNDLEFRFPDISREAYGWDPTSVTSKSGQVRDWKCKLGHIWSARVAARTNGIGCPVCSGKKVLVGFNDLKTTHPEIASQADGWDPTTLTRGHDKKMQWLCINGHKWKAPIYSRTGEARTGCPVCSGKKVQTGINDLMTLYPEIAAEAQGWDPRKVSPGNSDKRDWLCPKGHRWQTSAYARTSRNAACLICSNLNLLIGFNDLATTHPELAKEAFGWDPKGVMAGSGRALKWQCNQGHQWSAVVDSRARGRSCPYCARKKVLFGFNDLATEFPDIALEADRWDPKTVVSGSHRSMNWKCSKGHKYRASVQSRTGSNKTGCPICAGKQVLAGFNDLKTRYPHIALEAYGWDPTQYTSGSSRKMLWRCDQGHTWKSTLSDRTGPHQSGCPSCAKAGFDPNLDGWLYFLNHPEWQLLQIGITNLPRRRIRSHQQLGWEVIEIRGPMEGHLVRDWETAILRYIRTNGGKMADKIGIEPFDGYSESWLKESFTFYSLKEIMETIDEEER
jgi:hypothetical protein